MAQHNYLVRVTPLFSGAWSIRLLFLPARVGVAAAECRRQLKSIAPGYTVIFRQPPSRFFIEDTSFSTAVQFSAVGNIFFGSVTARSFLLLMMRVRAHP